MLDLALSVDPAHAFAGAVWFDVMPRSIAVAHLPETVLLHAGPPFLGAPPPPVRNAAVQALLFERLANNEFEALRLLSSGKVHLQPAQDHGVATPLAQVVSASMWLMAVRHHAHVGFAAMLEGAPPALRFGSNDRACTDRLRELGRRVTAHVLPVLHAAPVPLAEIIREAVAAGDDCHSRTSAANRALVHRLCASDAGTGLDADTAMTLAAIPAFVLSVLMAGAAAALRHHGSTVAALGGNGIDFGVRLRGSADWNREPALPPVGELLPGRGGCTVLPAIGDSVLVDFCGLGGQVDDTSLRDALRDPSSGILDPRRIAKGGERAGAARPPVFNLAMLDADGTAGLIGRGIYRPPTALFRTGV